jgi:hypothetical protein
MNMIAITTIYKAQHNTTNKSSNKTITTNVANVLGQCLGQGSLERLDQHNVGH